MEKVKKGFFIKDESERYRKRGRDRDSMGWMPWRFLEVTELEIASWQAERCSGEDRHYIIAGLCFELLFQLQVMFPCGGLTVYGSLKAHTGTGSPHISSQRKRPSDCAGVSEAMCRGCQGVKRRREWWKKKTPETPLRKQLPALSVLNTHRGTWGPP